MPDNIQSVTQDPKFLSLPQQEKRKVLISIDPKFAALQMKDQMKVVARLVSNKNQGSGDLTKEAIAAQEKGFDFGGATEISALPSPTLQTLTSGLSQLPGFVTGTAGNILGGGLAGKAGLGALLGAGGQAFSQLVRDLPIPPEAKGMLLGGPLGAVITGANRLINKPKGGGIPSPPEDEVGRLEELGLMGITNALAPVIEKGAGFLFGTKSLAPSESKNVVPKSVRVYLINKVGTGPLTAGEQRGVGFIKSAEPLAAKTAISSKKTAEFLQKRNTAIKSFGERLGDSIAKRISSPQQQTSTGIRSESIGSDIQKLADAAKKYLDDDTAQQNQQIAQLLSGQQKNDASVAADELVSAIQAQHKEVDALESPLYRNLPIEADKKGISGNFNNTASGMKTGSIALNFLEKDDKAIEAGGGFLHADVRQKLLGIVGKKTDFSSVANNLKRLSPSLDLRTIQSMLRNPDTLRQLQETFPDLIGGTLGGEFRKTSLEPHSFGSLYDARKGINEDIQRLKASGLDKTPSFFQLAAIKKAMTEDLYKMLEPAPELQVMMATANELTAEQHAMFSKTIVQRVMNQINPLGGEKLISQLLQTGNDRDAAYLMNIANKSPNKTAVPLMRRALMDKAFEYSDEPERVLDFVQKRPTFKIVLGDDLYKQFTDQIQQSIQKSQNFGTQRFMRFLKNIVGIQNPRSVIDNVAQSQQFANKISKLIDSSKDSVLLKRQLARNLFDRTLDKATIHGPFESPGSYFDPVKFSEEYTKIRPRILQFVNPSVLKNLDNFSSGMRYLTFSNSVKVGSSGSISSSFETLSALKEIGALGIGVILGHPLLGLSSAVGIHLTPKIFTSMALSEEGSSALAAAIAGNATRLAGAYATTLQQEKQENTPPAEPKKEEKQNSLSIFNQ